MTLLNSSIDRITEMHGNSFLETRPHAASNFHFAKTTAWAVNREVKFMIFSVAFIAAVSMYDVYWSFKVQDVLIEYEQNPIGTWLINLDNGDIALFMTIKMMGTMVVILAIPGLYFFRRCWGLICCTAVGTFQALLLCYLNFGHILN
jgi:hypothetical protein